eukprot:14706252-Heterocapsa_arctica.AAC.1
MELGMNYQVVAYVEFFECESALPQTRRRPHEASGYEASVATGSRARQAVDRREGPDAHEPSGHDDEASSTTTT